MLDHIKSLSQEEKDLVLHAPMYVSVLIAGADGLVDDVEKKRILELIHTKTFSEKYELRELYRELDHDAANELRSLIAALPENTAERNQYLSDMLSRLNRIMPKLEKHFARQLYHSLRQFAHYVATAEGGFWGVNAITPAEQEWVHLPMIQNPEGAEA
ncbi:MAG: hypothetical protein JNL57_05895 [Bacteroidetes bacterium]|nr:hypothetical protein [Bacteroidota bacterium]